MASPEVCSELYFNYVQTGYGKQHYFLIFFNLHFSIYCLLTFLNSKIFIWCKFFRTFAFGTVDYCMGFSTFQIKVAKAVASFLSFWWIAVYTFEPTARFAAGVHVITSLAISILHTGVFLCLESHAIVIITLWAALLFKNNVLVWAFGSIFYCLSIGIGGAYKVGATNAVSKI